MGHVNVILKSANHKSANSSALSVNQIRNFFSCANPQIAHPQFLHDYPQIRNPPICYTIGKRRINSSFKDSVFGLPFDDKTSKNSAAGSFVTN
jgi:hypothetical protein